MTRNDRMMLIETFASGVLTVIIISLMGWVCLTWPEPTPAPKLVLPETIRLHTAQQAAEQTYLFNRDMEARYRK